MPLGRSNTSRNNSRSPAPSKSPSSSQRPQFHPPAYYAAAGGLQQSLKRSLLEDTEFVKQFKFPPEQPSNDQNFMPVSYDGSIDRPSSDFHNNHVNSNQKFATSTPEDVHGKRRSQISNLPMVEAQLLPSLRDTIDRMTRPPSGIANPLSRSPGLSPRRPRFDISSCEIPMDFTEKENRLQTPLDPSYLSPREQGRFRNMSAPSTPKPPLLPIKPALKSALRSPTPQPFFPKSDGGRTPTTTPTLGNSTLKSVRSLMKRKPSVHADIKSSSSSKAEPKSSTRSRSCTDPGSAPSVKVAAQTPSTPQPNFFVQRKLNLISNIPRLRTKASADGRSELTDDSDLEYRYEVENRDRRKLVVANAEVFASSSSESEMDSIHGSRIPSVRFAARELQNKNRSIGLGLEFRVTPHVEKSGIPSPILSQRIRNERNYGMEYNLSNPSDNADEAHRRRKAALVGLVSTLGLDPPLRRSRDVESEYSGEEGFAVSGSSDPVQTTEVGDQFSESESEYEDERILAVRASTQVDQERIVSPLSDSRGRYSSTYLHSSSEIATPRLTSLRAPSPRPSLPQSLRKNSHKKQSLGDDAIADSRKSSRSPAPSPRPLDANNYESVSIALRSRSAAAREREAFGIPPSESDGLAEDNKQGHTRVDSVLSGVGSEMWNQDGQELSRGAEQLFRQISGGRNTDCGESRRPSGDRSSLGPLNTRFAPQEPQRSLRHQNKTATLPLIVSSASAYRDSIKSSWRSSLGTDSFNTLQIQLSDVEIERQELIWDLFEQEDILVERLSIVIKLFVVPLRSQDSKAWIQGVPGEIAKLLDWLDDIHQLHINIRMSLKDKQDTHCVVQNIAGTMLPFISKLEIYVPYVVKAPSVIGIIRDLQRDCASDFGEFIRIQEAGPDSLGWTLEQLLQEPLERLARLPTLFRQLLDKTPKIHSDYLQTLTLVRSTELMVFVMAEVKTREEEYNLLKSICNRITDYSRSVTLAKRDRRLLVQGLLYRVHLDDRTISSLPKKAKSSRSQRLLKNLEDLRYGRTRSDSIRSNSSASSVGSYGSSSSESIILPITSPSYTFKILPSTSESSSRSQELQLKQLFVFSDLALIGTPASPAQDQASLDARWTIQPDDGIVRILDVSELPGLDSHGVILILDVLPVDLNNIRANSVARIVPQTLYFALNPSSGPSNCTPSEEARARNSWTSAFRRSLQSTMRTLSDPSCDSLLNYRDLDVIEDTQQVLDTLVHSGLPFPKSPSVQSSDPSDTMTNKMEREERGWWTLRFQQVLREVQRHTILEDMWA